MPASKERKAQWNREWIKNNRQRYNEAKHAYRARVKAAVIAFYSDGAMCCARWGVDDLDVLCLDHINDDGAAHRKELLGERKGGLNFYEKVKTLGFPPGLQVLCAN
jgi:hypothetical protein